jgi:hypothetical protein
MASIVGGILVQSEESAERIVLLADGLAYRNKAAERHRRRFE